MQAIAGSSTQVTMIEPFLRLAGTMESKVKVSVVTLSWFDIRSAIQVSAAEGSSTSNNFGAAMGAFGRGGAGVLGGYSKTPEGKATVAAFIDVYNKMVMVSL